MFFFSKSHIYYIEIFFLDSLFFARFFVLPESQTETAILILYLKNKNYTLHWSKWFWTTAGSPMRCSFADAMFVPMFVSKWCSRWVVGMPIFVWNPLKVEIILDHGCLLYMPKIFKSVSRKNWCKISNSTETEIAKYFFKNRFHENIVGRRSSVAVPFFPGSSRGFYLLYLQFVTWQMAKKCRFHSSKHNFKIFDSSWFFVFCCLFILFFIKKIASKITSMPYFLKMHEL